MNGGVALRGNSDSVAAVARNISKLHELEEATDLLQNAMQRAREAGSSEALKALTHAIAPIVAEAQRLAHARATVGQALLSYATEIATLQDQMRRLQAQRIEVEASRQHARRGLAEIDEADALGMSFRWRAEIDATENDLTRIDQSMTACDEARERADVRCADAIHSQISVLRGIQQGVALGDFPSPKLNLGQQDEYVFDPFSIRLKTPEQIVAWWNSLSKEEQAELIQRQSFVIGNLNGVPFEARIAANVEQARNHLQDGSIDDVERKYWEGVVAGRTQLVTLDRNKGRIVEMLGELGPETERIITYVPGTTTNIKDFYRGEAGVVPRYVATQFPDAMVFVYKGFSTIGWVTNVDKEGLMERGMNLIEFATGAVGTDPRLSDLPQSAIGYSAGMPVISGAEISGAHYDQVISLGGSYVLDDWEPHSGTSYSDIRYERDILNNLDRLEGLRSIDNMPQTFDQTRMESTVPSENNMDRHGRLGQGAASNLPVLKAIVEELASSCVLST